MTTFTASRRSGARENAVLVTAHTVAWDEGDSMDFAILPQDEAADWLEAHGCPREDARNIVADCHGDLYAKLEV